MDTARPGVQEKGALVLEDIIPNLKLKQIPFAKYFLAVRVWGKERKNLHFLK